MRKLEFSKLVLCLVMVTYFAALIFGMVIIFRISEIDTEHISAALCGLLSFVAAPAAVAIGFYSSKAKAENVEKIKRCEELLKLDKNAAAITGANKNEINTDA